MESIVLFFLENWLTIFFGIFGIIGVSIGFRNKTRKELRYQIRNRNLIDLNNSDSRLEATFNGVKIKQLSVSKVVLINRGNQTIDSNDIPDLERIKIELKEEYQILDAKLITESRHTNNFIIEKINERLLNIDFDYVDPNEGCLIQLIHNGELSDDIKISGVIKGGEDITSELPSNASLIFSVMSSTIPFGKSKKIKPNPIMVRALSLTYGFIGVMLLVGALIYNLIAEKASIPLTIALILYGAIVLFLAFTLSIRKLPYNLRAFDDDFILDVDDSVEKRK